MKKLKDDRIKVGDNACLIDDSERGCAPWNCYYPLGAIKFEVSCKYQDKRYSVTKCKHIGTCDFQDEVEDRHVKEYPELFKK